MKRSFKSSGKERDYNILFLIQPKEKFVYLEASFSREPPAVLRKHWRGDVETTKDIFSKCNPNADPKMWMWHAGHIPRKKAHIFLMEWKKQFLSEGYTIIGDVSSKLMNADMPKLSGIEKRKLREISVDGLLCGKHGELIECGATENKVCTASQKFTTEAATENLKVCAKTDTVRRFRELCDSMGMTQNQVFEMLLGEYTGDQNPLIRDLQSRLEKANSELQKRDKKIKDLQKSLRKSKEEKEYPKIIQAARLQHRLVCEFMKGLPIPKMPSDCMIKRYSSRQGRFVFPERMDYFYPEEEGIVSMHVQHMDYSKGYNACLFIYGTDYNGRRTKIRWYPQKQNHFGEWMWDSPYLWKNSPWHLAVRKDGDVMELVGSIPDFSSIYFSDVEESDDNKQCEPDGQNEIQDWLKEAEELDAIWSNYEDPIKENLPKMNQPIAKETKMRDACLEELIQAAMTEKNRQKEK